MVAKVWSRVILIFIATVMVFASSQQGDANKVNTASPPGANGIAYASVVAGGSNHVSAAGSVTGDGVQLPNAEVDIDWLEEHLEDSHDYEKGYDLVEQHFNKLLVGNNADASFKVRELASRLILGTLRNNPPVKRLIWDQHPLFVSQVFDLYIGNALKQGSGNPLKYPLLKRYLSILLELIPFNRDFRFEEDYKDILDKLYTESDVPSDIKIKVLELITLDYSNIKGASGWIDRITNVLTDSEMGLDELHKRTFFNAMHALKSEDPKLKLPTNFLNWLAQETKERAHNLNLAQAQADDNDLKVRDLEQEEFDQRLVDSRHSVFGNPMAARMKDPYIVDEL